MSKSKYIVGSEVSWSRGELPCGTGVVSEVRQIEGKPVYMVREPGGNIHAFTERELSQGVSV